MDAMTASRIWGGRPPFHAKRAHCEQGWLIIGQEMGARWSPTTKRLVVALFIAAAAYLVWQAGDIVRPFIWAGILAYILLPVVGALEQRLGLPRTAAALMVFVALLALIFGSGRLFAPRLADNLHDLDQNWPVLLGNAQQTISDTFDELGIGAVDEVIIGPNVGDLQRQIAALAGRMALPFVVGFGHFLLEFLVFLIATFLFLRDSPRLYSWVRGVLPRQHRAEMLQIMRDTNVMLGRYIRGQVVLVGLMATVTTISLTILGVPYSFLLGIMTGVLETIPIVGPITAGAIACLVALGNPNPFGWSQIAYVGVVAAMYTILRHAEDYFVIPTVIGRVVRLHPAVVIFSLLGGGAAFGLLGVFLAVPVAATLRLVLIYTGAKLRDEDAFPQLQEELASTTEAAAGPAEPARTLEGRARL